MLTACPGVRPGNFLPDSKSYVARNTGPGGLGAALLVLTLGPPPCDGAKPPAVQHFRVVSGSDNGIMLRRSFVILTRE